MTVAQRKPSSSGGGRLTKIAWSPDAWRCPTFRLYLRLFQYGFRRHATYRAATFAGAFTNTVFGILRAYVLIALWQARPGLAGYDVADAVTFCCSSAPTGSRRRRWAASPRRPWCSRSRCRSSASPGPGRG